MPQIVKIPFATAAIGIKPGGREAEKFVLNEAADIVVEERSASDMSLAAVIRPDGRINFHPQEIWSMDGRLWRPLEVGRHPHGMPERVRAAEAFGRILAEDGWELGGMRWELPAACMPAGCFDRFGDYDYDRRFVQSDYVKRVESRDLDDAARRRAELSRTLVVVEGALWVECPPPRLVITSPLEGPAVAAPSEVFALQVGDNARGYRHIFRLDRRDEAAAFCEEVTGGSWTDPRVPSTFEIVDPEAIAFDDLVETARMVAVPQILSIGSRLPWFSTAGLEDFGIAKAAAQRLRETPSRDDAIALFEAFGRLAEDPGDPADIFDPMEEHQLQSLRSFALRASSYETADLPDLALGAPAP